MVISQTRTAIRSPSDGQRPEMSHFCHALNSHQWSSTVVDGRLSLPIVGAFEVMEKGQT